MDVNCPPCVTSVICCCCEYPLASADSRDDASLFSTALTIRSTVSCIMAEGGDDDDVVGDCCCSFSIIDGRGLLLLLLLLFSALST